ncbi:MAG: serine/threonine-protein phosphatase [Brevinematales bacterium]|nr:serine/threonine-protein phosphatase [Brevinematales bacterium]
MNFEYFLYFLSALIILAFSIEAIIKNQTPLNIAASLLLFFIATIVGSDLGVKYLSQNGFSAFHVFLKIENLAIYYIGFLAFIFSRYFPRDKQIKTSWILVFTGVVYFILCALISFSELNISRMYISSKVNIIAPKVKSLEIIPPEMRKSYNLILKYNLLHYIFVIISWLNIFISSIFIIIKNKKSSLIFQKKQIRYLMAGFFVFLFFFLISETKFLPSLINTILRLGGVLVFSLSLLYSIISYRFANLRNKIVSFVRENIISFFVILPFIIALIVSRRWFSNLPALSYFTIIILFFLFLLWFHRVVGDFTKRALGFKTIIDITEILFDKIASSRTIEDLAKNSIKTLMELINIRSAHFLYFNINKEVFEIVYSSNEKKYSISALNPFFRYLTREIDFLDREVINFDPKYLNIKDIANRYFESYDTALVIPLFYENTLTALIHIDYKIDNNSFTKEEAEIFKKLKKVCNLLLNNIILFEKDENAKLTKRDIILASQIQETIFQTDVPVFKYIDVYAYQKPAKEVSGDYFFIQKINDEKLGFILADVSGKGFSAAMVSMMIHTISQSLEFSSVSPSSIVTKINEVMTSNITVGKVSKMLTFATVFCGVIDKENGVLDYSSAGHHPAIVYDIDKNIFHSIKASSRPAGIFKEEIFSSQKFYFKENQIFVFYTDGITEAINDKEEEFGTERLKQIILKYKNLSSQKITEKIIEEVEKFAGEKDQYDDITLIVIKL